MEYQQLGQTDLSVSRISFGCWAIGGHGYGRVDDKDSIQAIRCAFDLGINFFDTADVYGFGHSEKILAKALGSNKNNVIIATKFGVRWDTSGKTWKDISPEYLVSALDNSLKRLGIERIRLYQIHWPDEISKIEDVMVALLKCRDKGKIQYIGCSNFSAEQIKMGYTQSRIESCQYPYNILNRSHESNIKYMVKQWNMGGLVYSVLGRGVLSGKYHLNSHFGENDTRNKDPDFSGKCYNQKLNIVSELMEISKSYGKTPVHLAVNWAIQNPCVCSAIIGFKTDKQVVESMGALGWSLTSGDMAVIDALCAKGS